MTVAPTIGWVNVNAPGYFGFHSADGGPGDLGNAVINIPAGTTVYFNAGTKGDVSFTITGNLQDGSPSITNISDTSLLAAGQLIQCDDIPYVAESHQGGDQPCVITAVFMGSDSASYANGIFDEDENEFTNNQPPVTVINDVTINVFDFAPAGELAALVSPGTGISVADMNPDNSGSCQHIGNGLAIMNLIGTAEGGFYVAFADSGDFSVTCSYLTSDPNYSNLTLAPVVNVVVA